MLQTSTKYTDDRRPLLRAILDDSPDLVAMVGVDADSWEEAMDMLCVRLDATGEVHGAFCNTTSHGTSPIGEVIKFAEQWCALRGWPASDVAVVQA